MRDESPQARLDDVLLAPAAEPAAVPGRRAWAASLLALAAFVAVAGAQHAAIPYAARLDAPLRAKLELFEAQKDDVDLLVVGTSHLYRGIVPDLLDARLAERGVRVRSFNLAYSGMRTLEADALLRHVLALRPARLRWVAIEVGDWRGALPERRTVRGIAWHDATATRRAARIVWGGPLPIGDRLNLVGRHVRAFAERTSSFGLGPQVASIALGLPDAEHAAIAAVAGPGRGFIAFEGGDFGEEEEERREDFVRRTDEYESRVEAIRGGGRGTRRRHGGGAERPDLEMLREQVAAVRAAGAEPVYVVGPEVKLRPRIAADAPGVVPAFLAFDDPAAHAELYATEHRFDANHLNARGAEVFTRIFADAFADEIARRAPDEAPR